MERTYLQLRDHFTGKPPPVHHALYTCTKHIACLSSDLSVLCPVCPLQAHDSPVRAMTWSHNDMWMLTADHGGYVKYWQSNMNNVKMFQAHKEAIREARFKPNLPFSVVKPSLCCVHSATRGRRLTCMHMLLLLLLLTADRCTCVLLQHCSDLLLLLMFLMWPPVLNKVIIFI